MTLLQSPLDFVIVTTACGQSVITTGHGITAVLTKCCQAAATGSGRDVVCKACYERVPLALGGTDLAAALESQGCPCPHDCAIEVHYEADLAMGLLD